MGTRIGVVGSVLAVACLTAVLAGGVGVAGADHGPSAANFTVTPLEDRTPGAENVEYGQTVVATAGVDLETLTKTVAIYEAGDWRDCGPTSASVFGIDRGATHPGYEVDEELTNNVKSFSAGEDRLETEYNDEDDLGASTYLDDGDEFVSVADCIDNPDTPGWYQITGKTTGVTADGRTVTFSGDSHYFWICECKNEAAARDQLGPPPSEPAATPTPAGTVTRTPTPATRTVSPDARGDARDTSSPTAGRSPTAGTATPRPAAGGEAAAAARTATRTPRSTTDDPESWEAVVHRTPTQNDGVGFGPLVAIAALLAATGVVRYRT